MSGVDRKPAGRYAMTLECSPQVQGVLEGIAEGCRLVAEAELAYRLADDRAGRLHAAAECAHRDLLRAICELSEAEADYVEPPFTALESGLLRLSGGLPRPFFS